jgi:hypothetical protein
MRALVLGVSLTLGFGQQTPGQPLVFKSGAYVIAIEIPVYESRKWVCPGPKPVTNLVASDFTVSLDKKTQANPDLVHDDKRPGHYLLSFAVPESARDGNDHRIDVAIKKRGAAMYWMTAIPSPVDAREPQQVENWLSEVCR